MSVLYWMEGEPSQEGTYLCAWNFGVQWRFRVGHYYDGQWHTPVNVEPFLFHKIYHPHEFFTDLDQEAQDIQRAQAERANGQEQQDQDNPLPFLGAN